MTVVDCTVVPLVPVMVTIKVPGGVLGGRRKPPAQPASEEPTSVTSRNRAVSRSDLLKCFRRTNTSRPAASAKAGTPVPVAEAGLLSCAAIGRNWMVNIVVAPAAPGVTEGGVKVTVEP